jgi:RNA polymerase sigma-70 factor (ECF subfamily)
MRRQAAIPSVIRVSVQEPTVVHAGSRSEESALLDALRRGDETAFVELVDRHSAAMLRIARQYVSTPAAAEAVVQETWLGVLRRLDGFEGSSSLRTWIFRILMNAARARGEHERRSIGVSIHEIESGPSVDSSRFLPPDDPDWPGHWASLPCSFTDSPERTIRAHDLEGVVEPAIAALPELQRVVVTLRDVEGWAADDVCDLLGLSDGSQRLLLHRGRARVRAALESYVEADAA